MLEGLRDAIENVTLGKGFQDFGINDNIGGRIVRSEQVLSKLMVDGLFEINGSISHSHHGSGNVHQSDTTVERRSNETTQVIDDSSTQGDDAGVLGDPRFENLVDALGIDGESLVPFRRGISTFIHRIGGSDDLVDIETTIAESLE